MPGITGSGKAASGTSPRVLREHPCLCASHRCKTKPRQAKIQEGRPKNVAKRRRRGQQTPGQRLQGQAQAKSPRAKGQRDSDTRKPRTTTRQGAQVSPHFISFPGAQVATARAHSPNPQPGEGGPLRIAHKDPRRRQAHRQMAKRPLARQKAHGPQSGSFKAA